MSKPRRHERKVKIQGISKKESAELFKHVLFEKLNAKEIKDRGNYVIAHLRIQPKEGGNIDVVTYSSDTIFISGSPKIPQEKFNQYADEIARAAQQSIERLEEVRPITLQRAKGILEFASRLDLNNEY